MWTLSLPLPPTTTTTDWFPNGNGVVSHSICVVMLNPQPTSQPASQGCQLASLVPGAHGRHPLGEWSCKMGHSPGEKSIWVGGGGRWGRRGGRGPRGRKRTRLLRPRTAEAETSGPSPEEKDLGLSVRLWHVAAHGSGTTTTTTITQRRRLKTATTGTTSRQDRQARQARQAGGTGRRDRLAGLARLAENTSRSHHVRQGGGGGWWAVPSNMAGPSF